MTTGVDWGSVADWVSGLGSFAAVVTALGLARASNNDKRRDDITLEIRNLNAAITTSSACFSAAITLYKDYIGEIKSQFAAQKSDVVAKLREYAAGVPQGPEPYHLQANYLDIQPISVPTLTLRTLIFEKTSIVGRPLLLLNALETSVDCLNLALATRHDLIIQHSVIVDPEERLFKYAGLKDAKGEQDSRFSDNIDALDRYTKSIMYYANLLSDDLNKYGMERRKDLPTRILRKVPPPRVIKIEIDAAAKSMLPPDSEYPDWHTAFKTTPSDKPDGS